MVPTWEANWLRESRQKKGCRTKNTAHIDAGSVHCVLKLFLTFGKTVGIIVVPIFLLNLPRIQPQSHFFSLGFCGDVLPAPRTVPRLSDGGCAAVMAPKDCPSCATSRGQRVCMSVVSIPLVFWSLIVDIRQIISKLGGTLQTNPGSGLGQDFAGRKVDAAAARRASQKGGTLGTLGTLGMWLSVVDRHGRCCASSGPGLFSRRSV